MKSPIPLLRSIGKIEAISFLILLGIAMPLKYIWHMPLAVRVVGAIHGGLFILFCWALVRAKFRAKWSLAQSTLLFIAALVPLGPFAIDGQLKSYEEEFQRTVGYS